jgi:hypothetical protein
MSYLEPKPTMLFEKLISTTGYAGLHSQAARED